MNSKYCNEKNCLVVDDKLKTNDQSMCCNCSISHEPIRFIVTCKNAYKNSQKRWLIRCIYRQFRIVRIDDSRVNWQCNPRMTFTQYTPPKKEFVSYYTLITAKAASRLAIFNTRLTNVSLLPRTKTFYGPLFSLSAGRLFFIWSLPITTLLFVQIQSYQTTKCLLVQSFGASNRCFQGKALKSDWYFSWNLVDHFRTITSNQNCQRSFLGNFNYLMGKIPTYWQI